MGVALTAARYLLSETDSRKLGASAAEVAFVGRSNAGKSTLLNALCNKKLAHVSGTPGRTRVINVYDAGESRWLVDLPGYGFAKGDEAERAGWGPMIEGYLTGRPNLRMVLVLVDAKVGPTRLDLEMLTWLQAEGLPWLVVATKSDQVKPSGAHHRRQELARQAGVDAKALHWVSAEKNDGLRELRAAVTDLLA
ncbi:MAG: ribosome biogenesis GTP-binding protein YihA/YsxC [Elusimicrobiota bacterium]|nr:ribosome biogenesis GTP-binding protein YihA/YsxC [Elusimicrobiota bacterium]